MRTSACALLLLPLMTACGGSPRAGASAKPVSSAGSAQGTRFVLDSFELDVAQNGVAWSTAGDQHELGTVASLEQVEGGAATRGGAARFFGQLGQARAPWPWASFSLNFTVDHHPVDLRAVTAIRYWARGDGKRYKLSLHKDEARDFANYEYSFVASRDWQSFEVPLSKLAQPSWGKPVRRVFDDSRSLSFSPTEAGQAFELYVDDVEFLVDPKGAFPWPLVPSVEPPLVASLAELARKRVDYRPISLEAVSNRSLVDERAGDQLGGWTDLGDDSLLGFPMGASSFLGVPFRIGAQPGKQALVLRGNGALHLPTRAEIAVGAKGKALYFLHASDRGSEANGRYEIRYQDGSRVEIALRDKIEIFDFHEPDASPFARPAWRGKNGLGDGIGVTLFAWRNPYPERAIQSIVASTPGHGAHLAVLGITLASDGPYLPPAPRIRFDDPSWFAYHGIDVAERRGTALDASALLDAPAGKHGVVGRRGEDFVHADGTKVRFWGMSITEQMNFPSRQQADFMAEFAAQLGFNMTRHQLLDAPTLDAERLERLDYLVAGLIKRGVNINLDLAHQKPLEFDEVSLQNQERLVRQLLEHVNPYTAKSYGADPAVAMVSISNARDFGQGELKSGQQRELLQKSFNDWLTAKYGERARLEAAWAGEGEGDRLGLEPGEDAAQGSVALIDDSGDRSRQDERYTRARVLDNYLFLYDVEVGVHQRMQRAIRATGYKGLITGSNDRLDQPLHYRANALFDGVDSHVYYSIPKSGYRYEPGVSFLPEPSIRAEKSIIHEVVQRRVAGSPYAVSEWSSLQPSSRNDALVMMAAYAGLHDFSPLMYSLGGAPFSQGDQERCKLDQVFELQCQGGLLALWPGLSRLFHERHVKESPLAYYRPIDDRQLFDPRTRVGLPTGLAYVLKTGMEFVGAREKQPEYGPLLAKYVRGSSATSITGELFTDWGRGLFTLDTPRSQAIVGLTGNTRQRVSNLAVTISNTYATVLVTSLDQKPIAKSARLLVSAVGNAVNRGMTLSPSGTTVKTAGGAPVLLEPMLGSVELDGLTGDTKDTTVHYLSLSGRRLGTVPVEVAPGRVRFTMKADYKALHYEVVREPTTP